MHGSLNARGHVGQRRDLDACGQVRLQLRQNLLDGVDDGDGVGAGLPLDIENHRRRQIHPGGLLGVLHAIDHVGDIFDEDWRAIAVGHHNVAIIAGAGDLVVGVDLVVLARAIEVALGGVDAGLRQGRSHILHVQAVGRQRDWIHLNPDCGLLAAADRDQPHAGQLRKLGRQARVDHVLNLRKRQAVGGDRQREDRRVRGIGLGVYRRDGQIGWKECRAAVDRRLHLFLGDIEREREAKLQNDDRHAAGAGRSHLA